MLAMVGQQYVGNEWIWLRLTCASNASYRRRLLDTLVCLRVLDTRNVRLTDALTLGV